MSNKPKGVVHCAKSTGITSKEADENQRRWTKDKYEYKNSDNKNHYDLSRSHLNFEIDQHGRIQPLGTSTPIHILEQKRLAELGNKPDKSDSKVKHIRVVEYLISGGADAMRKTARASVSRTSSNGQRMCGSGWLKSMGLRTLLVSVST